MPSSSEFPKDPVKLEHVTCGAAWEMYCVEWPPKLVVCPKCTAALKLVRVDEHKKVIAYRRI